MATLVAAAILSTAILAQVPAVVAPAEQLPPPATKLRIVPADEPAQTAAVAVSPATTPIAPGAVHRFDAVVTGTPNQQITWTATGGTISSDGTFTAGAVPGTYLVTGTITGGTIYSTQLIVVAGAGAASSYLSDRTWTSMINGWGSVEKDRSNADSATGDGLPLTLNGVVYAKGLGTHAASDLRYALAGACTTFTAVVGVDDEVGANGAVVFQVWTDGVKKFDSGVMTGAMPGVAVNVSVTGTSELALIVTDGGNGIDSDHADWADAQVTCATSTTYVSDRTWTSANNGWGPVEKDRSNGDVAAGDGLPLAVNGIPFTKGLGVHAPSDIRYALNNSCSVLTATIGLDDEVANAGSVVFQVWTDGIKRYDSGLLTGSMAGVNINVSVAGATELALIVTDNGNGNDSDHADWANAQLVCSTDTRAPTITAVTPANGTTGAALTVDTTAVFSAPMTATTLNAQVITLMAQGGTAPVPATLTYATATNTLTLHPTASLTGTTVYTATIKGGATGAKDATGNAMAADRLWSFTTTAPADTVAPTVTSVSPAAGTTGVALAANVIATFSEALTAATLTPATITVVPQGSSTPVAAAMTYTAASNTVTLDPVATLAGTTVYTATIKGGTAGVKDVAGNPLAADRIWTFTTTAPPDTTPPTITAITPAAGATAVALAVNVTATFSEALTAATLTPATMTVVPQGSTTPVAATVTYTAASNTATLDPVANLAGTTVYTATIKGGTAGVKDVAGNPLAADRIWTFTTTAPPDTTPPTITAITPAAGATAVALAVNVTATFSEALTAATITPATMTVVPQGSTTPVAATVTYTAASNTATLDPVANLAGTTVYTATIKGGTAGVKDVAGNPLAADRIWTFTTTAPPDTTPPTITAITPAAGATAVALAVNVTATFSEALTAATITPATMTVVPQGSTTPVAATVTYTAASNTVTLDPVANLAGTTVYTATIKGGTAGVKDVAGNPLAADRTWTFTTTAPPDTIAPTITAITPAAGATGTALLANVTAVFSEGLTASSLTPATVTLVAQGSATPVAATVAYIAASNTVTLTPTAKLAGTTVYTATVKSGAAGVKDIAGNPLAADRVWTFVTVAATTNSYLSDRAWTSAVNGWGPVEKDQTNGDSAAGDGGPLTLNGVVYAKGLGAHAASDIRFALAGTCSALLAVVGVDDDAGNSGSVVFQVWTDGIKQYDSGIVTGAMAGTSINVNVGGATELALIVTDGGDGNAYDHADWADAQVSCGPDVTAPTVTMTSPAAGATGVAPSANVTVTLSEPMNATSLTMTLLPQGGTTPVPATVSYDAPTKVLTLNPTANLLANTTYTATIKGGSAGAKDIAGNALAADKVWTMTTGIDQTLVGTVINPGDDIQAKVSAAAAGTAFVLKAGMYRMQWVQPKDGDTFTGEAGAVMSGARLLTSFARNGTAWVASGQTQQGTVSGTVAEGICRSTSPLCGYPEDLFINDVVLKRVGSVGEGGAGKWFFDYAADQIYFWDDPTGKRVETSVTPMAFGGSATGVTIRSVTIEKYATPTQQAAVNLGAGWLIDSSEVRWNHFSGINTGATSIARGNNTHHNGCFGITGAGSNILVENNEVAYNNYAGYDSFWGAGGSKWVYTDGLIVRGNFSHHNDGPGFWTDINNINTLYENNRIEDNARAGIFHEISYAAVIRNNTLRRNGNNLFGSYATEGGIAVCDSPNVEIYGNVLEDNWFGIGGLEDSRRYAVGDPTHGLWMLQNMNVHDNTIRSTTAMSNGCCYNGISSFNGDAPFTSQNNQWENNTYYLGTYANYFIWLNTSTNEAGWKATGHDTPGGVFVRP